LLKNIITIDVNNIVCSDLEFPCKDSFSNSDGRKDGVHYGAGGANKVINFILE
jgi:hypothetical protein